MQKKNNKGFSLVELIVVIAIMAVLIAVLAPSFLRYVEKSRNSADMQNAAAIVNAVQVWAVDAKVEEYASQLKNADGGYIITVTQDSFSAPDAPMQAALKNASLMNEDGTCNIRCISQSRTQQYEITIHLTTNGALTVSYNPAWIGGEDNTS